VGRGQPASRSWGSNTWPSAKHGYRGEAIKKLAGLRAQRDGVDRAVVAWVGHARSVGVTWAEIGMSLGVSQQAASKKYGPAIRNAPVAHP
jgi:hypothetical protein